MRRFTSSLYSSTLALLLSVFTVCAFAVEVESREVTVWSQGTRIDGDLWRPKGLSGDEKVPGIVVVHGWGGTKDHLNTAYVPQFAKLGFVVLTIDYRGWGDSDAILMADEPQPKADKNGYVNVRMKALKQLVDPVTQTQDTLAALHFIAGEPNVDSSKLGLWGSSLGGGVVMASAIRDSRVKAMVTQIGATNTVGNLNMPKEQRYALASARARGEAPQYPGLEAKNPQFEGIPDYVHFAQFDTMAYVDLLEAATLVIDAADEELFDRSQNGGMVYKKLKERGIPTKYVTYPGKHYDIYRGEQYQQAVKEAGNWFVKHLK